MSSSAPRGEQSTPLVTVILPTHDHATTVDLAGRSVLEQSVQSLELVVIGDGATSDVRAAVAPLLDDPRVRFVDSPKSESRAELVRHEVLAQATSRYVCYLGDDDLMLPDHLAATLDRLEKVDFTHPLPVYIDRDGTLQPHLTDLAEPRCRLWHQHPHRNAVSLSGVGHRLDAYLRLPDGWREAPADRWSDHYMWQQWFASSGFQYRTGDRLTVLKFEAKVRTDMTATQRRSEILAWLERSRHPDFTDWLADQAADAIRRTAIELRLAIDDQADQFARERDELVTTCQQLRVAEQAATDRAAAASAVVDVIQATRAWRLATTIWRIRDRLLRSRTLRWLGRGSTP